MDYLLNIRIQVHFVLFIYLFDFKINLNKKSKKIKTLEIGLGDDEYLLDVISLHDLRSLALAQSYTIVFKRRFWTKTLESFPTSQFLDSIFFQVWNL